MVLVAGVLFAGSQPEAQEPDYLSMNWDGIVEAAKEEGSLTFYQWWGEEWWKTAASQFSEKYGIDVKVIIGDLTANVNKVLAEKDKAVGTIDVMMVGGVGLKSTMDADVWYGPLRSVIPNAEKLDRRLSEVNEGVEVHGYLLPIYRAQVGLLYDPQRVSNPPQTWAELTAWMKANPKQFGFCDPSKGGTGQSFVQTAIRNLAGGLEKYYGDTELDPEKVKNWNLVWDWFNNMKDYYTLTASNNDSISRLNDGELSMVVAYDDDTLINMRKGTLFKRAKLYIPAMGFHGGGNAAGILKNAPHKAAGMLFIAYLIETDVQAQMNQVIGSLPARGDMSGEYAIISEAGRQNNRLEWIPAQYKKHFIEEFVKNVIMK